MTENKNVALELLKKTTDNYVNEMKRILVDNDLVYKTENPDYIGGIPFNGRMPEIDIEMIEDLFLDLLENFESVKYSLHEKEYVKKSIEKHNEYYSPVNRIKRLQSEIQRLKDKYNVAEDNLN